MKNDNAVPAQAAVAMNVSALETLLRVKATREEREAVLQEIGQVRDLLWASELRATLALKNLVMTLADYYAERLAATPDYEREQLQDEIKETAHVMNTYYIFDDGSELRINRDGEYEVMFGAEELKLAAASLGPTGAPETEVLK